MITKYMTCRFTSTCRFEIALASRRCLGRWQVPISRITSIRSSDHSRRRPSAAGPKITSAESLYFTRETWKRRDIRPRRLHRHICSAAVNRVNWASRTGRCVALLIAKHDGANAYVAIVVAVRQQGRDPLAGHGGPPEPRRFEMRDINHHSCIIASRWSAICQTR